MRVGGDFYYDPLTVATPSHLLLIAGGVGINPLLSMILHIRDLKQGPNSPSLPEKTTLLYTAQNTQELIFMVGTGVLYVSICHICMLCYDDFKSSFIHLFFR